MHPPVTFRNTFSPFGLRLRGFLSYPSSTSTNTTPFCTLQLLTLLVPFWSGLVFTFIAGIFGAALHPVIPLTPELRDRLTSAG